MWEENSQVEIAQLLTISAIQVDTLSTLSENGFQRSTNGATFGEPLVKGGKMLGALFALVGLASFAGMMIGEGPLDSSKDSDEDPDATDETMASTSIETSMTFEASFGSSDGIDAASDESPISDEPETFSVDELVETSATDDWGNGRVIEYSEESVATLPSPLEDWTQNDEVPIFDGNQPVELRFSNELRGSLHYVDANYCEGFTSSEGSASHTFVGVNVYFVPEGETFPAHYKWTDNGNTFYDSEHFQDRPEDFGGIKLIARLDGGSFASLDDTGENIFDHRTTLPNVITNLY